MTFKKELLKVGELDLIILKDRKKMELQEIEQEITRRILRSSGKELK